MFPVVLLLFQIPAGPAPAIAPMPREVQPPAMTDLNDIHYSEWDTIGPVSAYDLFRFNVTKQEAENGWKFGAAHHQWIQSRWWDTAGWENIYRRWCEDSRITYKAWDELDNAWKAYSCGNICHCRTCLANVRLCIGADAYYSGTMPPPAPYWWFAER